MNRKLDTLLNPKSIAIVGASQTIDSVGYRLLNNILDGNYKGKVYPINPKYDECLGLKCYKSIFDLDIIPDLVIIAIPAKIVLDTLKNATKHGVKNYYIITAGFSELGEQGKQLQNEISSFAKLNNLNIIGPNTIGFVNNLINLNANFGQSKCKSGSAVLISQSGALTSGILNIIADSQIGIAYAISIGNACDLNVAELIDYFNKKKEIKQILLYLESIPYPEEFMKVCKASTKKIICIKSGKSSRGAMAASSHTGALASADTIVDTFLVQSGVIRVNSIQEMIDVSNIYNTIENMPKVEKVAIITNAGGPGIITVDALDKNGFKLYDFNEEEKAYMRSYLQSQASVNNPIDMVASASIDDYKKTLDFCIKNPQIDAIICIHLYIMGTTSLEIAKIIDDLKSQNKDKLITSVFITHPNEIDEIKKTMQYAPVFDSGENVSDALKYANYNYPISNEKSKKIRNSKINKIIEEAKNDNRNLLTTYESLQVLKELKLPLVKYGFTQDIENAITIANNIGYPVAIKITSKTITHKSDVGGVKVNIKNDKELINAIDTIKNNLKNINALDSLDGFIIQEMKSAKREFVYGIVDNQQFGKCSMFGLGGIFVEALKDTSFKVLPTSLDEINLQVNSLKTSSLLYNIRNLPCVNFHSLTEIIQTINNFALSYDIKELDLNPLLIDDKDGNISLIDARIKI